MCDKCGKYENTSRIVLMQVLPEVLYQLIEASEIEEMDKFIQEDKRKGIDYRVK